MDTIARLFLTVSLVLGCACLVGCDLLDRSSWRVVSAPTPLDWPELTPVGTIEVKDYPVYRAAIVENATLGEEGMEPMFMELFRHIERNDISMTAPVEMEYDAPRGEAPTMTTMAFLYRRPDLGRAGEEGAVEVRDLEQQTFVSLGVRGAYTVKTFQRGLKQLDRWIENNRGSWQIAGPPRFLGYNGPVVPKWWRYGEVQVPVRAVQPFARQPESEDR